MTERPKAIIIGAGGHAKVVIDLFRAEGLFEIAGLIDGGRDDVRRVNGAPIIGGDADLPRLGQDGIFHLHGRIAGHGLVDPRAAAA